MTGECWTQLSSDRTRSILARAVQTIQVAVVASVSMLCMGSAHAANVPVGFADRLVATGLNSPTSMTILPDGRILVVQQNGTIRMIKNDALVPGNFHVVPNVDSFSERGCLGITADPGFATNHYLYVYCTVRDGATSHNRIFRITEANDVAVPGSEQLILRLPNVPAGVQWHMGGALRFGPDGKLYVAVGGQEDLREPVETSNSQNLSNPFGKILRLNPDGTVPADNPYVNTAGVYSYIYNLGLRNPFAFDIQPGTGLMYINDVGAGTWEEINRGLPAVNYGWPAYEGDNSDPRYTNAVFSYSHTVGCAITGGAFYNPLNAQFPASFTGKYLFADFCNGTIRSIDPANPTVAADFASDIANPVNLAVAADGSVYYLARNQNVGDSADVGTVSKIVFTNSQVPRITQNPQSRTVFLGDPITFTVAANDATSIQWQRNGVAIPGATSTSYTIPQTTAADNQATYTAVTSNSFGTTTSTPAVLTITTNRFPVPSISTPVASAGFNAGDTVTYSGTATDAEDGALPASAFTWRIDFMHDTHSHPFMAETTGQSGGSVVVPAFEADAPNTWFRLYLSVKDSAGQAETVFRDVYPFGQLSELKPVGTPVNGKGPIELNMNNGEAAAGDGTTISLGRIPYAKGIGVHAPSDIRYDLGGTCTGNFVADVGIDDIAQGAGSVTFQVLLDGRVAFDSGIMRGTDLRKTVKLSIAGVRELRLLVSDGGDGSTLDIANWAGARVSGCPVPATTPPPSTAPSTETPSPSPLGAGGGGCSMRPDGTFDPTLPGLILAALASVFWRRRKNAK